MKHSFQVREPDAGRRIERFLQRALGDVPPALVHKLLRKGDVKRNGKRARAGEQLAAGDELIVHHRATATAAEAPGLPPYAGPPVEILDRDADYLVLNKPAGARCSIDQDAAMSLQAFVAQQLSEEIEAGRVRPELCHRLDLGTTGVVLVALHAAAFAAFHAGGELRKFYLVLVFGRPERTEWTETTHLRRLPHAPRGRPKVVSAPTGEPATTRFRWLRSAGEISLLEAEPVSGRTHQIRAHLRALELPLLGDLRYGDPKRESQLPGAARAGHQLLHAHRLELPQLDPARRYVAPLPGEFTRALLSLGLSLEGTSPGA